MSAVLSASAAKIESEALAWIAGKGELGCQQRPPVQLYLHVDMPGARAVVAGKNGTEAIGAIGRGHRFAVELIVRIAPRGAAVVRMQVDPVVVGLPDLDDRARHRHAPRVGKSAAEFYDITRRRTTRPLHDYEVAVPIGRLGNGIIWTFRLRRRESG